jgi:hypothetical protein
VVSDLQGHHASVSALFVASDRASLWSGDVQGHVICWAVPLDLSSSAPLAVPCTCPQSAQHLKSMGASSSAAGGAVTAALAAQFVRQCTQCDRWICAFCRLEHARKEHPYPRAAAVPPDVSSPQRMRSSARL